MFKEARLREQHKASKVKRVMTLFGSMPLPVPWCRFRVGRFADFRCMSQGRSLRRVDAIPSHFTGSEQDIHRPGWGEHQIGGP